MGLTHLLQPVFYCCSSLLGMSGRSFPHFSQWRSLGRELPEYAISLSLFLQSLGLVCITVQALFWQRTLWIIHSFSWLFWTRLAWVRQDTQKECDCKDFFWNLLSSLEAPTFHTICQNSGCDQGIFFLLKNVENQTHFIALGTLA